MAELKFELKLNDVGAFKRSRGLEKGGAVQRYVDRAVVEKSEPYVPFDTGRLKNSPYTASVFGSGKVVYGVPYAKKQYYENKGGQGLRGRLWAERMKADKGKEIIAEAAEKLRRG